MRYCLLFHLLCCYCWRANAQISDSLYKALPDTLRPKDKLAVTDQEKLRLIANSSRPFVQQYYTESKQIVGYLKNKIDQISPQEEKIPYADGIASFYANIGDNSKSIGWFRKITRYGQERKKYRSIITNAYINLGIIYAIASKQDSAVNMLHEAASIATVDKNSVNLRNIYYSYIPVYGYLLLEHKALESANKFLMLTPIQEQWQDSYTEVVVAKARLYTLLFRREKKAAYADSATRLIQQVLVKKKDQAAYWYHPCYTILGGIAYYQKDYQTALRYFNLALSPEYTKSGSYQADYKYRIETLRDISLLMTGHPEGLHQLLATAIPVKDFETQKSVNEFLYQYYEKQGNYQKALTHYRQYHVSSDSIDLTSQRGRIFEAEQKYSVAQKEAAIAQLENKNLEEKNAKRDITIVSLIILLVLLLLYLYNRRQLAKRALEGQQLADKLQTMEKEMALQQIKQRTESESALNAQRKSISRTMHDEVSSSVATLRFLIKDRIGHTKSKETKQVLAELEDETTEVYQQVRDFMHRLHISGPTPQYDVIDFLDNLSLTFGPGSSLQVKTRYDAENIECHFTPIHHTEVYLFIKEAVSNAMKHSGASQLTIELFAKNGNTYIDVRDNGKGLDNNTRGIGMESMQERMKVLGGEVKFWTNKGLCILASFPVVQATVE